MNYFSYFKQIFEAVSHKKWNACESNVHTFQNRMDALLQVEFERESRRLIAQNIVEEKNVVFESLGKLITFGARLEEFGIFL